MLRCGVVISTTIIMKNHRTREDFSAKEIVIAYIKLFTSSSHWFVKELVQISIVSLEIEMLANTIKTHCCGKDQFSNLCLNLNDSLYRITEAELAVTDEQAVKDFRRQLYLTQIEVENQELLQELWQKLEFPMKQEDVLSLAYNIQWIGQRIDSEKISKEGDKLVIKPQDNYELAYAPSYIKELIRNLHRISDVSINWNDNGVDRAEKVQPYWNQKTGKVQLMRYISKFS